jgi:Domain of unknown function (DUF4157)
MTMAIAATTRDRSVQRKCACAAAPCARCAEKKLRRAGSELLPETHQGEIAPPIVDEVLSSPGHPLDPPTRAFMEPRFNDNFARVRVHTHETAARAAKAVGARAFTVGQPIVVGGNEYSPRTDDGRMLMAHELTHSIQQRPTSAASSRALEIGAPGDVTEIEAKQMADRIIQLTDEDVAGREPVEGERTPYRVRISSVNRGMLSRNGDSEVGQAHGAGELPEIPGKNFKRDEDAWQTIATYAFNYYKQNGPDEARAGFDDVLHSDQYGGRLKQIRQTFGG